MAAQLKKIIRVKVINPLGRTVDDIDTHTQHTRTQKTKTTDSCHFAGDFNNKIVQLVVSTHLKNISQNGNLPQVGMKLKNI